VRARPTGTHLGWGLAWVAAAAPGRRPCAGHRNRL